MRNRAFGVEIECGVDVEPECRCECFCVPCGFCEYGCEESLEPDEECSCECECECCSYCSWGCDGYCGSDEDPAGYAAQLLHDNGFRSWTDYVHEDGSGVEIPSPILTGYEGLRELKAVLDLLRRNGFYVTSEDGLHVHHDAPEFVDNEELTARLVELWEENLSVLDCFVAEHRRGGDYWACNSYKQSWNASWRRFKQSKSLGDLHPNKFRSLNITALREHGTIEFRLHEGTLDFNEAYAWIHLGQSMLETAKRRRTVPTCATPLDLLRTARVSSKSTRILMEKAR